jgi:hypothetical protein
VVVKNLERRSFDYREFAARCGARGNKIWAAILSSLWNEFFPWDLVLF